MISLVNGEAKAFLRGGNEGGESKAELKGGKNALRRRLVGGATFRRSLLNPLNVGVSRGGTALQWQNYIVLGLSKDTTQTAGEKNVLA